MRSRQALLAFIASFLALATAFSSEKPSFEEAFLIVLIMAVLLEVRSTQGTRHGPFGCAAAFYLTATFSPGSGPTGALICCLVGLTSRYLFGPSPKLAATYIADFFAISVAAFVSLLRLSDPMAGFFLTCIAFMASEVLVGRALYPLHKATRITRSRFAVASLVAAIPAVYLAGHEPLMNVFLGVLLLIVQSGGYMRIRQEALVESAQSLRKTKEDLRQAHRETSSTHHRLERTTRERELVENLARHFARNPNEAQVVQACLEATIPLFPEAKRSLWRLCKTGFERWSFSADGDRGVSQALLSRCWESQNILAGVPGGNLGLVLVPLPGQGVLALQLDGNPDLSENRKSWLTILASQFALGLQSARYRGELEEALKLQKETNSQLQRSQEQLVQSGKMAAVGQLAAGVAHELNSPLAAALLQVQAGKMRMEMGNLEKVTNSFEQAEVSLSIAQEIIDKLLGFSRASQQQSLRFDLTQAVKGAWELTREQFVQDGVEVVFELTEELWVQASPPELQQVFVNLLINARHACQETRELRPPRISIRGGSVQGMAAVVVSDSGPGVAEEIRSRIFEPFFTTKPIGEGTGLGLAISFEILKAHRGHLEMKSTTEGASFRVLLPLFSRAE